MCILVKDLPSHAYVDATVPHRTAEKPIDYQGSGWYSLDDDEIYRPGTFATFSRIYVSK